jgi:integrase/recombinase XerD
MLLELFPRGHQRYARSRFAQDLEGFCSWLEATGFSRKCARGHLFRLRCSLERMTHARPGATCTVVQLDNAFGADCAAPRTRRSALYRATRRAYQRFLSSQGRLKAKKVNEPFTQLRHDYRRHLVELRGLVNETIQHHDRTITDFLRRALPSRRALSSLTGEDVEGYLVLKGKEVGRQHLQHVVAHLRAFLRYCHDRREIRWPLHVIDAPRAHLDELPPRALDWSLVQALLRSIDRSSRSGWRDYTMLHLLAHYGLRPSEVVSLRLDSINWDAKTLMVEQRKTRSALVLPLVDQTLSILRRYLAHGRPSSTHSELFLRARCPSGALKRTAVTDIFDKRAEQCGLSIDSYSAYSLRHAFAMRLLNRGVGLKAIADLLGHRSLATTCLYLRLDMGMLRDVALPVPTQVRC